MRPSDLIKLKQTGKTITILTAWDTLSGALVEASGADAVLVGDSLAMVALGHATTLPVTTEQMLHHTQAVTRGFRAAPEQQPLVICDLPFLSYQCGEDQAMAVAGRLMKESSAAAVKLEGAEPEIIAVIDRLVRMGIPGVEYFAHPYELNPRIAKEFLFTGNKMGAERAYQMGMVNQITSREALMDDVTALATKIAAMPRLGLALTKQAINNVEELQGKRQGMEAAFAWHHFAHAHNDVVSGDKLGGFDAKAMAAANKSQDS